MKIFFTFFIFCSVLVSAQTFSYGKSTFESTGEVESMITPELVIKNESTNPAEVFVKRFYLNLPANWTQCFCYINCHDPQLDTLRFVLMAGESATIGAGFNTSAIPGTGYMRLTVEEVGGVQRDTMNFKASTLGIAGLKENFQDKSFQLIPNPFTSAVVFSTASADGYKLSVFNITGKLINETEWLAEKQTTLRMDTQPPGAYYIRCTYRSGKTEIKKIIKN